ncbi:MAG: rhomboid family intramembrane serine protease [Bryobacterales bacterium]|nr:rhomboid family intramembrane serine protease [Bryobacterales bacterium]
MRYTTSTRDYRDSFYPGYFPSGVKWLLISNTAVWLVFFFAARSAFGLLFQPFKLVPGDVVHGFALWQLATYLFLHDPFGFSHILFNMLTLWMFGADLEREWGTRQFLRFYFLCGIGAGVCVVAANAALGGDMQRATIGASGAIYGLLMAFGVLFPDRIVLFSFLFPMKAKYFVTILGAIAFLSSMGSGNSNVSNVAHLGGMIFGYIYLKSRIGRVRFSLAASLTRAYREWKLARAKRKFKVYLRKQGRDSDRWVN